MKVKLFDEYLNEKKIDDAKNIVNYILSTKEGKLLNILLGGNPDNIHAKNTGGVDIKNFGCNTRIREDNGKFIVESIFSSEIVWSFISDNLDDLIKEICIRYIVKQRPIGIAKKDVDGFLRGSWERIVNDYVDIKSIYGLYKEENGLSSMIVDINKLLDTDSYKFIERCFDIVYTKNSIGWCYFTVNVIPFSIIPTSRYILKNLTIKLSAKKEFRSSNNNRDFTIGADNLNDLNKLCMKAFSKFILAYMDDFEKNLNDKAEEIGVSPKDLLMYIKTNRILLAGKNENIIDFFVELNKNDIPTFTKIFDILRKKDPKLYDEVNSRVDNLDKVITAGRLVNRYNFDDV